MTAQLTWPLVFGELADTSQPLKPETVSWAMEEILGERATDAHVTAFILGLKLRGETPEHVAALASVMLDHAQLVPQDHGHSVILDIVGTGGDGSHSVNISTMSAIVAAACGVPVIKHGNRAVSSATGAADVLEELGVVIDLDPEQVARVARDAGIAFCFAPRHHPATRFAVPARKLLGIPTVFNILGPLTNPAGANAGLIGCANLDLAPIMARVLRERGVSALVVRGTDGLDEISLTHPTQVWDATGVTVTEELLQPTDFGVENFSSEDLRGGERDRNAELLIKVLGGQPSGDDEVKIAAIRMSVAVNAAAALVAASSAAGEVIQGTLAERINSFIPQCLDAINSGSAWDLLQKWVTSSREV